MQGNAALCIEIRGVRRMEGCSSLERAEQLKNELLECRTEEKHTIS